MNGASSTAHRASSRPGVAVCSDILLAEIDGAGLPTLRYAVEVSVPPKTSVSTGLTTAVYEPGLAHAREGTED